MIPNIYSPVGAVREPPARKIPHRIVPALVLLALLTCFAAYLLATSTVYTQAFASGHGWSWTQVSCSGTCTNGDNASDGNPLPSIFVKIVGKNKTSSTYYSHTYTWENLGVPAGDVVTQVDGQWDDKQTHSTGNCSTSATAGMDLYDSANTTRITASQIEPNVNMSGDTSWTTKNATGAVDVSAGYQASSTTITLRFNLNPAGNSTTNADCTINGDTYKLTITSAAPSGRKAQTIVAFAAPRVRLEYGWLWGITERLDMPVMSIQHLETK